MQIAWVAQELELHIHSKFMGTISAASIRNGQLKPSILVTKIITDNSYDDEMAAGNHRSLFHFTKATSFDISYDGNKLLTVQDDDFASPHVFPGDSRF